MDSVDGVTKLMYAFFVVLMKISGNLKWDRVIALAS
jgi:hypothetical protein